MENFGIGVDIEKIDHFKKCLDDTRFLQKIFTPKELDLYLKKKNQIPYLAGRFCAKEALIKAFGTCQKNIFFQDIEIFNDEKGAPFAVVKKCDEFRTRISISHDESYAVAVSLIQGDERKEGLPEGVESSHG